MFQEGRALWLGQNGGRQRVRDEYEKSGVKEW